MTIYMFCIFVWGAAFVAALFAVIFGTHLRTAGDKKNEKGRPQRVSKLSGNVTLGEVRAYCAHRDSCVGCEFRSFCPAPTRTRPEYWDFIGSLEKNEPGNPSAFTAFNRWIRLAKILYDMGARSRARAG